MMFRSILSRLLKHGGFLSLRVRGNGVATLASADTSVLGRKPLDKGYVISYLVNSCGLSQKKAISASKSVHFDGPDKPNAAVDFLKNRGFTQPQIATLVEKLPGVLTQDVQNTLLPKLEFFSRSTRFSETEIREIVCAHPDLLHRSLKQRIEPNYNYVKDLIGAEKVDNLIRRGAWIFNVDLASKIMPNVDLLREAGVPPQFIKFALANCTHLFVSDNVRLRRIVEEVKEMGFDPLKTTFVLALRARIGGACAALWDRTSEVYRRWGWSEDDIRLAYTTHPGCMVLSEKKILTVMEFIVNKLGREPRSIARCPQVLFYSMESRIAPRCCVVHRLSLEGFVDEEWSFMSVLPPVEKTFLDRYVTRYVDDIPELYDIYRTNKGGGVARFSEQGRRSGLLHGDVPQACSEQSTNSLLQ